MPIRRRTWCWSIPAAARADAHTSGREMLRPWTNSCSRSRRSINTSLAGSMSRTAVINSDGGKDEEIGSVSHTDVFIA
ncbi:MAG TPA: hypothetical protein VIU11_28520 [Nakamurella sp.]